MSKRRARQRLERFLREHPYCCFCGGQAPANTIDHVPSIQLFALRQRPKGLEFPACNYCNRSTGPHEQVAALLSRAYPDATGEEEQRETRRIMHRVRRDKPLLFSEMSPSWRQQYDYMQRFGSESSGGGLNASGPLVNRSMQFFGAKLGLALHYECTRTIVPASGAVAVRWYTNFDRMTGTIPTALFEFLGEPQTLTQGKWSVPNQFTYAWAASPDNRLGQYVASFRLAFMLAAFVHFDPKVLLSFAPEVQVVHPGQWG